MISLRAHPTQIESGCDMIFFVSVAG